MTVQAPISVSEEQLSLIAAAADFAPSQASPLNGIEPGAKGRGAGKIKLTNKELAEAAAALAAPQMIVRLVIPGPDETLACYFYRAPSTETFVGFWPEGQGWQLSLGWEEKNILSIPARLLFSTMPPPPLPADYTFDPGTLVTFAACIDTLRTEYLQSVLRRSTASPHGFTQKELKEAIALGLGLVDGRWLVSLLALLSPSIETDVVKSVGSSLKSLASMGLLKQSKRKFAPAPELALIAGNLRTTLPAVSLSSVRLGEEGSAIARSQIAIIKGNGPLQLVDFGKMVAEDKPEIRWTSCEPPRAVEMLETALNAPREIPQSERNGAHKEKQLATATDPKAELASAKATSPPAGQSSKKSKKSGAPAKRKSASAPAAANAKTKKKFCTSCGVELRPDAKFCTGCGAKTARR